MKVLVMGISCVDQSLSSKKLYFGIESSEVHGGAIAAFLQVVSQPQKGFGATSESIGSTDIKLDPFVRQSFNSRSSRVRPTG